MPSDKTESLTALNALLDVIRSNLSNIRATWGERSPQYREAKGIMESALVENCRRLGVVDMDLEQLMKGMGEMSLDERGVGRKG